MSTALAVGSKVLDGRDAQQLGLPFWAWEAIGLLLFFAMVIAVLYRRQVAKPADDIPLDNPSPDAQKNTFQVICKRCGTPLRVEKYCFWLSVHNYTEYSGDVICQQCGTRAPTEKRTRCTAKTYHTFTDFRT